MEQWPSRIPVACLLGARWLRRNSFVRASEAPEHQQWRLCQRESEDLPPGSSSQARCGSV